MNSYWDLSEKERSELTEDNVRSILDVELMRNGILKPKAPDLKPIPKNPVGPRRRYFGVSGKGKYGSDEHTGIVFSTIDAAQKFADLLPHIRTYDYEVGSDFTYCIPISDAKIEVEELYDSSQINEFRSSLKHRKALSEENQKLSSAYTEATSKADQITDGVWKNWYDCLNKMAGVKSIVDTYQEYLRLTNRNIGLALTFLEKAHGLANIAEAREWFPGEIPTEAPPECLPAENLCSCSSSE